MARRMLLVRAPLEDSLTHEQVQPGAQDIVRDARSAELLEATSPHQGVAHDDQRPPLAHDVQGARDWTSHIRKAFPSHSSTSPRRFHHTSNEITLSLASC